MSTTSIKRTLKAAALAAAVTGVLLSAGCMTPMAKAAQSDLGSVLVAPGR